MSRLLEKVEAYIRDGGSTAKIAVTVNRHQVTVERWIRDGLPSAEAAYELALAIGCNERDARQLASECISFKARDTA